MARVRGLSIYIFMQNVIIVESANCEIEVFVITIEFKQYFINIF